MLEPIFLQPVYKDYIWGGTRLKDCLNKKNITTPTVAESWEISTNENGKSTIAQGEYRGLTLDQLFKKKELRKNIFGGKSVCIEEFPLLIKFIDANQNLSVQVHPNDVYAKEQEHTMGKNEMWYIMDCAENAKLICGMKDQVKQEEVEEIIKSGRIKENLKDIAIKPGDAIYIPAGTIHAILENTLICEIQQNSNITYRVYDWDRVGKDKKPRELHIDKAIDVIDVSIKPQVKQTEKKKGSTELVDSQFFKTTLIQVEDNYQDKSNSDTFYTMNVVKGEGKLKIASKEYEIRKGDSFLIPATLGNYIIEGTITLLKSQI